MKNLILFTSLLFSSFALSQKVSFSDAETYVLTSIQIHKPYPEYIIFAKESKPELFLPKDEFETTAEYKARLQVLRDHIQKSSIEHYDEKMQREIAIKNSNKIKKLNSLKQFSTTAIKIGEYDADEELFKGIEIKIPSTSPSDLKLGKTTMRTEVFSLPALPAGNRHSKVYITLPRGTLFRVKGHYKFNDYIFIDEYYNSGIWVKINGYINRAFASISNSKKIIYPIYVPRNQARSFKKYIANVIIEGSMKLNDNLFEYDFFDMVAIHPNTKSRFPFGPQNDDEKLLVDKKKAIIPPYLTMKVAFMEPNGNSFLDAGETGKIKVSISNSGKGSAVGVAVNLNSINKNDQIVIQSPKQILGEISPGDTEVTEFEIIARKGVKKVINEFTITVDEAYGYPPDPIKLDFETYPFLPPKLVLADHGVETPNERNEIRPLTAAIVETRIQNQGTGPANNVVFDIGLPNGVYFTPDSKQQYSYDLIDPGQFKDLNFSFNVSRNVGKQIKVMISYVDENKQGSFPLVLDVAKPQQSIQQLSIKGSDMKMPTFSNVASISVDVEKNIPKLKRNGKNDLAVIFGIENYKNVSNVSFAKRDADWMKVYFENILGIPSKRIYFKTDSDVGQAEFSKVFSEDGWLDKRLKKEKSNIFIYYAGHGAPDIKKNSGYLIPYDGDPNYPSQTGYKIDLLYSQLGKLEAKSATVFLDACFSGANRNNQMLLADARPVLLKVKSKIPPNVSVFSAASGMEFSSSWPQKKHGLFTYFLMKGMKKEADTNQDKKITYGELGDYINLNVSETAGMLDREQTPQLKTIDKDKILISF